MKELTVAICWLIAFVFLLAFIAFIAWLDPLTGRRATAIPASTATPTHIVIPNPIVEMPPSRTTNQEKAMSLLVPDLGGIEASGIRVYATQDLKTGMLKARNPAVSVLFGKNLYAMFDLSKKAYRADAVISAGANLPTELVELEWNSGEEKDVIYGHQEKLSKDISVLTPILSVTKAARGKVVTLWFTQKVRVKILFKEEAAEGDVSTINLVTPSGVQHIWIDGEVIGRDSMDRDLVEEYLIVSGEVWMSLDLKNPVPVEPVFWNVGCGKYQDRVFSQNTSGLVPIICQDGRIQRNGDS